MNNYVILTVLFISVALLIYSINIVSYIKDLLKNNDLKKGSSELRRKYPTKDIVSDHVVIDTLNIAHWYFDDIKITSKKIIDFIDYTAPILTKKFKGRVMYVIKDRETQFNNNTIREKYKLAADRNKVYILVAEKYVDPPMQGAKFTSLHSCRGRDDFYMSMLAFRYKCGVLTRDRLQDFSTFKYTIPSFYVIEYAYWRTLPFREFINPPVIIMKKPRTLMPSAYFNKRALD